MGVEPSFPARSGNHRGLVARLPGRALKLTAVKLSRSAYPYHATAAPSTRHGTIHPYTRSRK